MTKFKVGDEIRFKSEGCHNPMVNGAKIKITKVTSSSYTYTVLEAPNGKGSNFVPNAQEWNTLLRTVEKECFFETKLHKALA